MRISDWSSDVCSSDLDPQLWTRSTITSTPGLTGTRPPQSLTTEGMPLRARRVSLPRPVTISGRSRSHSRLSVGIRSEEHTSELQSLMRISYAVFCLKKKTNQSYIALNNTNHIIDKPTTNH